MTDEVVVAAAAAAAIGTTVTLTPIIEKITYGFLELTSAEVIDDINEYVLHNKQIKLEFIFPSRDDFDDDVDDNAINYDLFRFNATADMQNAAIENSRHIKTISICNDCSDKDEHRRCFYFLIRIVLGLIGKGKHLSYTSYGSRGFELEHANQLAQALRRSNNNNNGAIESFDFLGPTLTPVTFQLLWNALLDSGVRKITFKNKYDGDTNYNNINIDFAGMKTNTSLKELNLSGLYHMREEDYRNLFHSMKVNKGLVGLLFFYTTYKDLSEEMKRLFQEMLCENSTLLDCRLYGHGENDPIVEVIQFHMKLNLMWKRYMRRREREKKTPVVIRRIEEGDNNNNNNNEEEERKKRLKMRLLLHVFMKKPVMRDTIIFHLLSEYPDDLVSNNNSTNNEHPQQNPLLLRIINSNLAKNKRKRTTDDDDSDNERTDGTNDSDENDGDGNSDSGDSYDDIDSGDGNDDSDNDSDNDSESDDSTDGTL